MFEAHVLHLLRRYLGEYVHGLSAEALRISVWKGDVVLKDLQLKADALNALKLPVTVKAGFVGTITLKVPWKSLGKEPVIVLIDRVFVLAHPASDGRSLKDEDREKLLQAKLQQIEEAESAMLDALARSNLGSSVQLERLAMYHDSNSDTWKLDKRWEDLSPKEWIEIFEDGVNEQKSGERISVWARDRNYIVSPINGVLKYHRLGNQERNDPDIPFEKASLVVNDVSLAVTEAQYHDWIRLMEAISRYKKYVEISHLRPLVPVLDGPNLWWRYAALAGLQQKKMCSRFSWDQIKHLCHLRRCYVQLYANSLQQLPSTDILKIREIETNLDAKVILLWRLLAHAKVESVKKEAADRSALQKRSWFSFKWRTLDENALVDDTSEGSLSSEERLTKEEWQAINKLLSYQSDEYLALHSTKEMQNMIRYLVDVSISKGAARIININQIEIACGRFENLHICTRFRNRSTYCDATLKLYGLSAPEGSLAQSVSSEQKVNALQACFVYLPTGENLDWRLSAKISPCHVTIFMESYHRFLDFVKRSNAVSPSLALQTAAALQNKIEKVTRRAQEQFQMVLEEQSRFALDIDLDAPKVRVPIRTSDSQCDCHLLLDFGHFTLLTKDGDQIHDRGQSLYSRFLISGKDITAFFTDCGMDVQSCSLVCQSSISPKLEDPQIHSSLVDRCGMAIIVEQIKVPHPRHPSTRISIQVPSLGIHLSPVRYHRLIKLLNVFHGSPETSEQLAVESSQSTLGPWNPLDLASEARILVWKGIGYSVAAWQPCYIILSGLYLYVLESEMSRSYQRCSSMAGKQVLEVPPANVGGSPSCIAVCVRGVDAQKALESFSSLIIELRNEEDKAAWFRELVRATYRASDHPSVDILRELSDDAPKDSVPLVVSEKSVDLVVNGALLEAKLSVYGKFSFGEFQCGGEEEEPLEENMIIQFLAGGGKVHVSSCEGDLVAKMKLHSLKIKDELQGPLSSGPQYLACSFLADQHSDAHHDKVEGRGKDIQMMEEDDTFTDALPDFLSFPDSSEYSSPEKDLLNGKGIIGDIFYEAQGSDESNFVSVVFLTRNPTSPDYDGIDTQMSIRMSKLEFYCNRPTIVALISLSMELSSPDTGIGGVETMENLNGEVLTNKERIDEQGIQFVKGLLGHGKSRTVFYLDMNVDSVTVFLNKEDGSHLAMFVQESFLLDIKVHPSSISIEGSLGNLRLCDPSLGPSNCWGWLCDIRNQGTESLVQFSFKSYSSGDDDYEGYDYSLCGRLSAVRIVFLYRFVQEITAYFVELATPHTEEAIKLVDKVGGIEWLIQKYEIDGATAVKLDLSLDTPVIIVPRNSMSSDFMQLDLGHLRVKNEFSWHGCPDTDPSAVHLDVLNAAIVGVNLAVGINGCIGKPMIREGRDIHVYVRRSLRDVFRKVPTFVLEVKVGLLHGEMSNEEYNVILDCFYMNMNEQPRPPPSFRGQKSASKDTIRMIADRVNMSSQVLLSRTVTIISVHVNYALLELHHGLVEESTLAHIALEGLWVSYRMTSLSEADLYVTIPKFSILDVRPRTKPEMRLMLGSSAESTKLTSPESSLDTPTSTMLVMDCRWRTASQSFVLRIQQPRILVVPDFLLAVCEFFVPALGTITGREELMDPKNDPIWKKNSIVLASSLYKQTEDVEHLSPDRQLIADAAEVDEYTYDGCGKIIHLSDGKAVKEHHSSGFQPIIIVGRGKKLRFVNVKIQNASLLRKCTYLSNESSYTVFQEDGVELVFVEKSASNKRDHLEYLEKVSYTSDAYGAVQMEYSELQSFSFETQVVSPEFTFYDSSKSSLDDFTSGEKLLRAKMDFNFMYASKGSDRWVRGLLKDLCVESGSGLMVLDPVDISGGYTSVKDKSNISLFSSDICIHLSLSVLSLLLNLQGQVAAALHFGNADPLSPCTIFDRIWISPKDVGLNNHLTFWRPRAPSNYVILGDCVTSRPNPPSQTVLAVSSTYGRVRSPLGFNLVGLFPGIKGSEGVAGCANVDNVCSLWSPVAPPGYLALGCVAHVGHQPPPLHVVHCIRSDLVTSTTYSECIFSGAPSESYICGFSIWRMDNAFGSFYSHPSSSYPPKGICFDLNHLLRLMSVHLSSSSKQSTLNSNPECEYSQDLANSQVATSSRWDVVRSISKSTTCYMSTPHFKRVWWAKGSDLRQPVSIWRPVVRPGYAALGDCITEGLEPPSLGILFKIDNPEISAKPAQFTKVAHIGMKGIDEAFFWYPIAPPGYASLGCVVTLSEEPPSSDLCCCPRMDLVSQANILDTPITKSFSTKASQCWSIWKIENQACTFLARPDCKKPSSRLAFAIWDYVKPKTKENTTTEMKIRYFSLSILDSMCGTMTPLFDTTVTNIKLATHGRLEAMNAALIASISASTFNTQLEAWEPFLEPFEGIFKFETYDTNLHSPTRFGTRIRIAATSVLNINLSAANIDTIMQGITSWRKQRELEKKAIKLVEEACHWDGNQGNASLSALDEEDIQTVIIENKLGSEVFIKRTEQSFDRVDILHPNDFASVRLPPPRYSDRLNIADESREPRRYVSVCIVEAKGLPVVDDGNRHNFFCALRLVVENQDTNQQKLFPQSARTRCVKPSILETNGMDEGIAIWNELFIFEVPRKGLAKLEMEVTNLAAKAGKGEVVGACSFSVGHAPTALKKVASVRTLHHAAENVVHQLKGRGQDGSEMHLHGSLLVSTSYLERKVVDNFRDERCGNNDCDVGFCVGLAPEGAWESFRSFLPLSVMIKTLKDEHLAVEILVKDGKKHAILRSLAKLVNDSDTKLEMSIFQHKNTTKAFSSIAPGSSSIIPWGNTFKDSNYCLRVRPCMEQTNTPYEWGHPIAQGADAAWGKDQFPLDQGAPSRLNSTKIANKLPVSFLRLDQLEKKDILFCCPSISGKDFWLSIETDASVLHTELNSPVYDWKISVSSPLKLENRLPCPADFTIWERVKDGRSIEQQRGFISSRGTAHVYYADVRNPIYLTLFVHGGWVVEKDAILILDLASGNRTSSFWMVHHQRKRRLRVSIEHDMGGTAAASKTIRFFVPYWISNDSFVPLAYRVVEIEPVEGTDVDSVLLSKAVKSAKSALRTTPSFKGRQASSRKNIQVLDAIEDTSPTPSMLSPQDYVGRGGVMLFSSRNDTYLSPRVGISVAVRNSENFSAGIPLLELEKKQRVDVKAFGSDGSYYNLSALMSMTSDRTKVLHFQPHTLYVNRVGCGIYLQQCNTHSLELIHPTDPPKVFGWQSSKAEFLKLRISGYEWSTPFSVNAEGMMTICLTSETKIHQTYLRVEVRSGTKASRYEVIFRPNSVSSPYRIENRSLFLPIRFRQVDGPSESWRSLLPNAAAAFSWQDLGRERLLEIMVDGTNGAAQKYNIDEISAYEFIHVDGGTMNPLLVTVLKEDKTNVVRIGDWMPEDELLLAANRSISTDVIPVPGNVSQHQQSISNSGNEFHLIVEVSELGLSVIDHTPEEILYMSMQNLLLSYSSGLGSGISRLKIRMRAFQVDNQLPLTPSPVLLRPQRVGEENDYILKFSLTQQSNGSLDLHVYPYVGFQGPENSAFLINIHEPIIWRIHGMIQQANFTRLSDSQSVSVSVDPIIQIGVLNISEVRFKVSMAMSPSQRPVGVLGFWSSLMTALGNTENMPVRINQRFLENISMRQSVLIANATANIKKDLLSQPFQLLSGVDILGNASSALGHMSKGVAALSMDKKFIQSRQRQENKGVEDFGDVIREGGGAFAKGLFRGVTGILTKPLEGAKASGVEGFVQGVGKGIIGAAAQPVSGVLDLLSKTTEGANAVRMKIASAIASEDQLLRRRLPRVIHGDNLLRPYDEYKARGQAILQLAECGSFFGQVDLFRVRGKFALTDAYEDHFLLPKGRIVVITHRRIILLQQPSNIIAQKKYNPTRDPCSVSWEVLWDDLVTMELTNGKEDNFSAPPSRLVLYLQSRSTDAKEQVRVIKCSHDSSQAMDIYSSIEQALDTYGPSQSKAFLKRKVTKPYSPVAETIAKGIGSCSPILMPASLAVNSTFGNSEN